MRLWSSRFKVVKAETYTRKSSFSSMPALRHFGSMLLIGVAASVLLAPLAVTLEQRRCD